MKGPRDYRIIIRLLAAMAAFGVGACSGCDDDLTCSSPGAVACRSEQSRFGSCRRLVKRCLSDTCGAEGSYMWLPPTCRSDSDCTLLTSTCEFPSGMTVGYCVCK